MIQQGQCTGIIKTMPLLWLAKYGEERFHRIFFDYLNAGRATFYFTLSGRSDTPFPKIVCLCGSTRFWREFQHASLKETLAGNIVLSIGAASGTDDEHFGNLPREEYNRVKGMLDELHKRKIDLADEVLILNVGGYLGESTLSELHYAREHGRAVRWWETDLTGKIRIGDTLVDYHT